jgi:hypothetical protein
MTGFTISNGVFYPGLFMELRKKEKIRDLVKEALFALILPASQNIIMKRWLEKP